MPIRGKTEAIICRRLERPDAALSMYNTVKHKSGNMIKNKQRLSILGCWLQSLLPQLSMLQEKLRLLYLETTTALFPNEHMP